MKADSSSPPMYGVLARLYLFWSFLVEPSSAIDDPELRRRSRLLAALALPFIPSFLLTLTWGWTGSLYRVFTVISTALLLVAYVLNRTGRYRRAAFISVTFMILSPFALFISRADYSVEGTMMALMWVAPALILAYMVLSLRGVFLTTICVLLGIAALPVLFSEVNSAYLAIPALFNAVVALLVLIAAMVHSFDLRQLAAQSKELLLSERRYRDLFRAASEGILVHQNGVILDANPAFEALSGYTLEELVGTSTMRFFSEDWHPFIREQANDQVSYEAQAIRKDGTKLWVEVRAKTHTYRGETVRVATVRDITERREADSRNLELTIEREKVKVLQRFIGDMSHDLRTPLSVIKTCVYLLGRLKHDPEKLQRQIEVLEAQTNLLQRLFDDLLSMSRLDRADTTDYRFDLLDVNALLAEVVAEQQDIAKRKMQRLTAECEANLPLLQLDGIEFKRMMKHLILNGLNYTGEGGAVIVRSRRAEDEVWIEVEDTGKGINPLDLPHIFDRFYRGDPARGDSGGTGLGLAIARKVAEAHRGRIEAQSELGVGSTFRVRLPVPQGTENEPSALMNPSQVDHQ